MQVCDGPKQDLAPKSPKSWFGPSQTCTVGDFLLHPKISENYFFHYKSFPTITKRSSTVRNVISSSLDAPKGTCLAIGQNPVLGDFASNLGLDHYGPAQSVIFYYTSKFSKIIFFIENRF